MKETLTLEMIAPYLPYGLKVCYRILDLENGNPNTDNPDDRMKDCIMIMDGARLDRCLLKESDRWYDKSSIFKPLLRPLSQLTEEIEHNGERFVPVDWFEIGDDSNLSIDFDSGNVKLIKTLSEIAKHNVYHDVQFLPYAVVKKLIEWKFDINDLLSKQLAIEITSLKQETV